MQTVPRKPIKLHSYYHLHEDRMAQFRASGFVGPDNVTFTNVANVVVIKGWVACEGRIVLEVEKYLKVLDPDVAELFQRRVATVKYKYQAWVAGHGGILRYDNAHAHEGHPDEFHRHQFDWRTDEEVEGPLWVGLDAWPVMSTIVQELYDFYVANRDDLPSGYADLDTCVRPGSSIPPLDDDE